MYSSHPGSAPIGAPALTADGQRLGEVVGAGSHYFVVEQGLLFTTDLHLPLSAIDHTDVDGIHLSLSDADIEAGDWAMPPPPDVPLGRDRPVAESPGPASMPRYVGVGVNGENGYDHHALLKKP